MASITRETYNKLKAKADEVGGVGRYSVRALDKRCGCIIGVALDADNQLEAFYSSENLGLHHMADRSPALRELCEAFKLSTRDVYKLGGISDTAQIKVASDISKTTRGYRHAAGISRVPFDQWATAADLHPID